MIETRAASLRPGWRSARWWLVLTTLLVLAAFGLALASPSPGRPLDPASPAKDGSRALTVLLAARGTSSRSVSSLAGALGAASSDTVVITSPDDFSSDQLRQLLDSGHRLVAVAPDTPALGVLSPGTSQHFAADSSADPDCTWPGAQAAGTVDFPSGSQVYSGPDTCYGGRVIITPKLVILGTSDLLTNGQLGNGHLAAAAINALSADGAVTGLVWLIPGADAAGAGAPTIWSIFPPWVGRAVWQLGLVGLLLCLWRGRRLGPVVKEPLPVIVRAVEVVEGHGRLYLRARARDRAAAALREGTLRRLAVRFRLHHSADAAQIAAAVGPGTAVLLDTRPPADDHALLQVAHDLRALEQRPSNGALQ
jgi:Domain of unknown function (DUF4350)